MSISSSDVNNTKLFNAEPVLLVFDAEKILSFSGKKNNPSRGEILAKRAQADLRL